MKRFTTQHKNFVCTLEPPLTSLSQRRASPAPSFLVHTAYTKERSLLSDLLTDRNAHLPWTERNKDQNRNVKKHEANSELLYSATLVSLMQITPFNPPTVSALPAIADNLLRDDEVSYLCKLLLKTVRTDVFVNLLTVSVLGLCWVDTKGPLYLKYLQSVRFVMGKAQQHNIKFASQDIGRSLFYFYNITCAGDEKYVQQEEKALLADMSARINQSIAATAAVAVAADTPTPPDPPSVVGLSMRDLCFALFGMQVRLPN